MSKIAEALGLVMMGVRIPKGGYDSALRTWAEVEYKKDKHYAYHVLSTGKLPNIN